jgi:hypothetical protein
MQMPEIMRPELSSIPPIYAWPKPLKRAVLVMAIGGCLIAYGLLLSGLVSALFLLAGIAMG